MIIRRKHSKNFTVVPNQPIDDKGISYDALGLLTYLLSRPDNWTVWVEQLRSRGGIGRDKTRRLIRALCEAGYIVRRKVRDPETQVFVSDEYVVYDEPVTENPSLDTTEPVTENPAPGKPSPENPSHNKDGKITSTDNSKPASEKAGQSVTDSTSKPRRRIAYTPEFEAFWKAYPDTKNNSKSEAFKEWGKLDAADQQTATDTLPAYRKHLAKETWLKAVYAERYLKYRRFDGYAQDNAVETLKAIDWGKHCSNAMRAGQWSDVFGPAPGQPGCKVPPELVTEQLVAAVRGRRASA